MLYAKDKPWAADLSLIHKREPKESVFKTNTDRMRMIYRTREILDEDLFFHKIKKMNDIWLENQI